MVVRTCGNLRNSHRPAYSYVDEYCRAGFSTVVQDNIFGDDVPKWLGLIAARPEQ
jgi:hypothetical protein